MDQEKTGFRHKLLAPFRRPRSQSASPSPSPSPSPSRLSTNGRSPSSSRARITSDKAPSLTAQEPAPPSSLQHISAPESATTSRLLESPPVRPARLEVTSPPSSSQPVVPKEEPSQLSRTGHRDLWEPALANLRRDPNNRKLLAAFEAVLTNPVPSDVDDQAPSVLVTQTPNPQDGAGKPPEQPSQDNALQTIPDEEWLQILKKHSDEAQTAMGQSADRRKAVSGILSMIEKAKDGITFATSFEPHAAMAWSAISFLLPGEDAVSGLEYISYLLTRYRLHETTYLDRSSTANPGPSFGKSSQVEIKFVVKQFEKHTTALYEKILIYQLRMACHYAQGRLKRYARNATMRDDWKGMLAEIKKHESNADFDMRAVDSSRIHSLVAGRDDDLRRQILSALSCDYESTKESHPTAVPGTCKWFLDTAQYQNWVSGSNPFMLLTSGPGNGKSVLLRYLVDHISSQPSSVCCYYFFRESGTGGDTVAKALSAVLHQLCLQLGDKPIPLLKKMWQDRGPDLAKNLIKLWQLLTECVSQNAVPVTVILDALDEAAGDSRMKFMQLVNQYYQDAGSPADLRLLISARPYFNTAFSLMMLTRGLGDVVFDLDDRNQDDEMISILQFEVAKLDLSGASKMHLLTKLVEKQSSSRSFLWLKVIFDYLTNDMEFQHATNTRIDLLVQDAPTELYDVYEKLLQRSQSRGKARILLHLVLAASEPLTLPALQLAFHGAQGFDMRYARVVDMMQRDQDFRLTIGALCGLFVTVINDKVYLFHQTAREFLTASGPITEGVLRDSGTWKHSFQPIDSHWILERACNDYNKFPLDMSYTEPRRGDNKLFQEYAAANWLQHHALGSHRIQHFSALELSKYREVSHFPNASGFIADPRFYDLASERFWAWYCRSGLSTHQLRFEWSTWLVVMVTQLANATFDESARRLLLLDEADIPPCRVCHQVDCPKLLRFNCSSDDNFKQLHRLSCEAEYDDWLRGERDEKRRYGEKKRPAGPSSSASKGKFGIVDFREDSDENDDDHGLARGRSGGRLYVRTITREENVARFNAILHALGRELGFDQSRSPLSHITNLIQTSSEEPWRTSLSNVLKIFNTARKTFENSEGSIPMVGIWNAELDDKETIIATVRAYRDAFLKRLRFLEEIAYWALQEFLNELEGMDDGKFWFKPAYEDGKSVPMTRERIVQTSELESESDMATSAIQVLRVDLKSMAQGSTDAWFPLHLVSLRLPRGRDTDIDMLAVFVCEGLSEFLHEVRKGAYSVQWILRTISWAWPVVVTRYTAQTREAKTLKRSILSVLAAKRTRASLEEINSAMSALSAAWGKVAEGFPSARLSGFKAGYDELFTMSKEMAKELKKWNVDPGQQDPSGSSGDGEDANQGSASMSGGLQSP